MIDAGDGPVIALGAVGLSGGAIATYLIGRFARLEDSLSEAREDIAAIMATLNISPRRRRLNQQPGGD